MKFEGYDGEFLSEADILALHDKIIDISEFDDARGFRDENGELFENSYYGIFAGFGGYELYPTVFEKICRLSFNIISTHVFANANKRTGLMVLLQLLDLNDFEFKYTQDEMFDMLVGVASHEIDFEAFLSFVKERILNFESINLE